MHPFVTFVAEESTALPLHGRSPVLHLICNQQLMPMKPVPHLHLLPLLLLMLALSCQKVELESPDSGGKNNGHPSGQVPDSASCYHVSQLSGLEEDSYVYLEAYIVGHASASSKSSFTLGLPQGKEVRSNILVADAAENVEKSKCAPCQLEANSDVRDDLNLVDNPHVLGRKVRLYGKVHTYFGVMGLKPVVNYEWATDTVPSQPQPPADDDAPATTVSIPVWQETSGSPFEGC